MTSTVDWFGAVSRFDEAALGLERGYVGASETFGNIVQGQTACGDAVDQALSDGLAFAVAFAAKGLGDVHISIDQPRQMDRHQPPRILSSWVTRLDAPGCCPRPCRGSGELIGRRLR